MTEEKENTIDIISRLIIIASFLCWSLVDVNFSYIRQVSECFGKRQCVGGLEEKVAFVPC